ncbi:MAG: type II toxin-antitoxin system YafQ family toxin [Sulfuricurvum sp.]|nr:type II toxin-antitoxin system YafQ family toxin [Sulfuricurvum sp.]
MVFSGQLHKIFSFKDHPLIGDYESFREFHISGDLLIIYCIEDEILKLTRIGSHSQLFG